MADDHFAVADVLAAAFTSATNADAACAMILASLRIVTKSKPLAIMAFAFAALPV